jgi:hypothetical protein
VPPGFIDDAVPRVPENRIDRIFIGFNECSNRAEVWPILSLAWQSHRFLGVAKMRHAARCAMNP